MIEAKFAYNVNYNPEIAKVELGGVVVFSLEPKLAKQILKDWKKKKIINLCKEKRYKVKIHDSHIKKLK